MVKVGYILSFNWKVRIYGGWKDIRHFHPSHPLRMPSFTLMSYRYVTVFVYILCSSGVVSFVSAEWPIRQYSNFPDTLHIVLETPCPRYGQLRKALRRMS